MRRHRTGDNLNRLYAVVRNNLALAVLLSAWFNVSGCASSVYSMVKMQVEREMSCVCDQKPRIEDVSTVSQEPNSVHGQDRMKKTYQASCCGDRSVFECLPEVREQNNYSTVEDRGRMPTVDVIWHCWKVKEPIRADDNGM